ncbi:MAG: tetratricopeptide repeat protein [Ectothiorhodospiraceae bacterium]|nr:tetratricopeptide repeat protein [Ectothiorhodospiraceae bacterium]
MREQQQSSTVAGNSQAAYGQWLAERHPVDKDLQRALNRFAARREPPLVLTGAVDGPLSAQLANWARNYAASHQEVPVFVHHLGASRESRRREKLVHRLLNWLRETAGLRDPAPAMADAASEVLPNWLARTVARGRLVLVLDGIDLLEGMADASSLDWLPAFMPEGVRLVVSLAPGPVAEALMQRGWHVHPVDKQAGRMDEVVAALSQQQQQAARALWASRDGLADSQLAVLECGAELPESLFYRVGSARLLAGGAVQDAVARRLLPDGADRQAWHDRLARLHAGETSDAAVLVVWHLVEAAHWEELARTLTRPEVLQILLRPEFRADLFSAWQAWGAEQALVDYYASAVSNWALQDPAVSAGLLLQLAAAFRDLGLEQGLEPFYQQALAHQSTAAGRSAYGGWLLEQQRQAEAEPVLVEALQELQQQAADAVDTRAARHRLAMLLEQQNRLEEARTLYREALRQREATLGDRHVELLPHLNNLAAVCKALQDYDAARQLYQRALTITERQYGQKHPTTAACLDNLAGLLYAGDDLAAAEDLYQRALGIAETAFGPSHPATAASAHNLGTVMDAREQFQAAEQLFRQALAIREQVLGEDHMDTASSLHNLAGVLDAMGRYDEAEPLYRRALEIWEKVVGLEHPATATSANNLADLLREKKEFDEAESLYRRNLDTWGRLLGERHPHTVMTLAELAGLYVDKGDHGTAEPMLQRALQETESVMGAGHPQYIGCVTKYAALLRDGGRQEEARQLLRQALKKAEGTLGLLAPGVQKLRRHLDALDVEPGRLH